VNYSDLVLSKRWLSYLYPLEIENPIAGKTPSAANEEGAEEKLMLEGDEGYLE